MRTPDAKDLLEAADALLDSSGPTADACKRVAAFLERKATIDRDRGRARSLGCTVKYLRKVVDHG